MLTAFLDMETLFGALNLFSVWGKALGNTADFTAVSCRGRGWHFTRIKVCFEGVDSKPAASNMIRG